MGGGVFNFSNFADDAGPSVWRRGPSGLCGDKQGGGVGGVGSPTPLRTRGWGGDWAPPPSALLAISTIYATRKSKPQNDRVKTAIAEDVDYR